ncbi:class I SAM-dependent methyltransferase [Camelliibacillus cellulosilyticus]|uniref:Class I SAM-dependent methyltransferase n=1 Tax=Camelliibacillus cellulosilyticus TaxID=2174486 RepID=A0ABV9GJ82_9BACL
MNKKNVNYGIDAPVVIRILSIIGVICLFLSILSIVMINDDWLWLGGVIGALFLLGFLLCSLEASYMFWSSKVGKFRERDILLDMVNLQGDEMVLDVGCGRGILLIGAARRLQSGRAVGLDIWNIKDQSGNHPDQTRMNAAAEGVVDRIELVTGDMRDMPFDDDIFDVVISSLAIHNIKSSEERKKALTEILRVLKPGGRFAILDFQHTEEYKNVLAFLKVRHVKRVGPHLRMFPPVHIVIGEK